MKKPEIEQSELDRCILHKDKIVQELPKGLDRHTLKKVWQAIAKSKELFTTEQMAQQVGLSRVSMRKYLEFLQKTGVIQLDICYGAVGRPTYKYYCIDGNVNVDKL